MDQVQYLGYINIEQGMHVDPTCWHYDACVVLDGNPLVVEQLTCIW